MSDEISDEELDAADRILARLDGQPQVVDEIASCIRRHTAARGIDVWAVEFEGKTPTEWAELTGRDPSTVARNVRRATGDDG